jgi:starch synthase
VDAELEPERVLFVTPECAPYAKVGGLADVVAALSKALRRVGIDARILMPLYGRIDRAAHGIQPDGTACIHMGAGVEHWVGVHRTRLDRDVPVWLLDFDAYYGRRGIYHSAAHEYLDNGHRFALLSKAALQLCKDRGFIPDVMHLHDWPAAVTAVFLKTWDRVHSPLSSCASVLTIHNIGHQGKVPADVFGYLGVGGELFNPDVFEDYGRVNLLKGGVCFADAITTVSPTHLREIRSPDGGHGLAPYLNRRGEDLAGILNGVDYEHWNPETDPLLPARYGAKDLSGKAECKLALQRYFHLPERPDVPVFGLVTRLALQKGIDLLRDSLPRALGELPMQLVVLGTGEPEYERFFNWLSWTYRDRVGCHIGYSEELAHLIEGGSDFFLMPSLYEPCGLNQIYSMKYGTLPVVRSTGGLADTVESYDPATGEGTGFSFDDPTGDAVHGILRWVVETWYQRRDHIEAMQKRAMAKDFSWGPSTREYLDVYRRAMTRRRKWA